MKSQVEFCEKCGNMRPAGYAICPICDKENKIALAQIEKENSMHSSNCKYYGKKKSIQKQREERNLL